MGKCISDPKQSTYKCFSKAEQAWICELCLLSLIKELIIDSIIILVRAQGEDWKIKASWDKMFLQATFCKLFKWKIYLEYSFSCLGYLSVGEVIGPWWIFIESLKKI